MRIVESSAKMRFMAVESIPRLLLQGGAVRAPNADKSVAAHEWSFEGSKASRIRIPPDPQKASGNTIPAPYEARNRPYQEQNTDCLNDRHSIHETFGESRHGDVADSRESKQACNARDVDDSGHIWSAYRVEGFKYAKKGMYFRGEAGQRIKGGRDDIYGMTDST